MDKIMRRHKSDDLTATDLARLPNLTKCTISDGTGLRRGHSGGRVDVYDVYDMNQHFLYHSHDQYKHQVHHQVILNDVNQKTCT